MIGIMRNQARELLQGISIVARIMLAATGILLIGLTVFVVRPVQNAKEHSKRGSVKVRLSIPPGGSQAINAYMESGNRLNMSWSTNGARLVYQYQLIEGHADAVLGAGLSDKGGRRFTADHGSLYGVAFQNPSPKNAIVVVQATGSFEFFRAMPFAMDAQKTTSAAAHGH